MSLFGRRRLFALRHPWRVGHIARAVVCFAALVFIAYCFSQGVV